MRIGWYGEGVDNTVWRFVYFSGGLESVFGEHWSLQYFPIQEKGLNFDLDRNYCLQRTAQLPWDVGDSVWLHLGKAWIAPGGKLAPGVMLGKHRVASVCGLPWLPFATTSRLSWCQASCQRPASATGIPEEAFKELLRERCFYWG